MRTGLAAGVVLLAAAGPGCIPVAGPAECALDAECGAGRFCAVGECHDGVLQCPLLEPRFASLERNYFRVGCGVRSSGCHSAEGAALTSGLDLATDPYRALVGAAGDGAAPANPAARVKGLRLVKPGDAAASFLLIKLRQPSIDPAYGEAMPFDDPGSSCAASVDAIEQWIVAGARRD